MFTPKRQLLLSCGGAFALTILLLAALGRPTLAATQCVAPGGTGGCFASIQAAVDAVAAGDTIQVVAGVYAENIIIDKDLTLLGGFDDTTLATRTPRSSRLDGGQVGSVLEIRNGANVTVDGFTIQRGDGTTNQGHGGGIFIRKGGGIIHDNLITSNVASHDPNIPGRGGGIGVISGTLPISITGNTIALNTAYAFITATVGSGHSGAGGGIRLLNFGDAVIVDNIIQQNFAAFVPATISNTNGYGGGIDAYIGTSLLLRGNTIEQNQALNLGRDAFGGGVSANRIKSIVIDRNVVTNNRAAEEASNIGGGGLNLGFEPGDAPSITLTDNEIQDNTGATRLIATPDRPDPYAGGGGVNIWGGNSANETVTLTGNLIAGNTGAQQSTAAGDGVMSHHEGGGLRIDQAATVILEENVIAQNVAANTVTITGTGNGAWNGRASGGGIFLFNGELAIIRDNDIRDNSAVSSYTVIEARAGSEAGGLQVGGFNAFRLEDNRVTNNSAVDWSVITGTLDASFFANGGGIRLDCNELEFCTGQIISTTVEGNKAAELYQLTGPQVNVSAGGGGISVDTVYSFTLEALDLVENMALGSVTAVESTDISAYGGGLSAFSGAESATFLTIRASNILSNTGAGTIVRGNGSTGHENGGGVYIDRLANVEVRDSRISANKAADSISVTGDDSNTWMGRPSGGGLMLQNTAHVTVTGNEISNNMTVRNHSIDAASTTAEGGGLALIIVPSAVVDGNLFADNKVVDRGTMNSDSGLNYGANGGGLFVGCWEGECTTRVSNNQFRGNVGGRVVNQLGDDSDVNPAAGALYSAQSEISVTANEFTDNSGMAELSNDEGFAGAMRLERGKATVTGNLFQENMAAPESSRPIIFTYNAPLAFSNNILVDNGGGVELEGDAEFMGQSAVTNNTLYANGGTALSVRNDIQASIHNNIMTGHEEGIRVEATGANSVIDYNLLANDENYEDEATGGAHDITDVDPRFVESATFNVQLLADSPAIDAGDNAVAPMTDYAGNARPVDGNADGAALVDMGAYEFVPPVETGGELFLPALRYDVD